MQGDVTKGLDFPDDSFDLVLSSYVLHGLSSELRRRIYSEASRLSRGRILFYDYNHKRRLFTDLIECVLEIISSAKEEINALAKGQRGIIYLGATLTIGEYILPNILAFLYNTHPDVDFKVKIANTESISQDVLEKKLHIGLIEGPVHPHKNLNVEKFWEDELVAVLA